MLGRFVRCAIVFLKKEEGPTAVEYAVMLALIIAILIAAISNIGGTTSGMYNNLSLRSSIKG
jgi:pilus assembly protein Flp/PilA